MRAAPETAPEAVAVVQALGDWRRDALLLCLLPVFCWPAAVAAVLTRPEMLVVLLSPVVLGARELRAVRRVRRVLRDPAVRWAPYEAEVVRARRRPPAVVLVLGEERHALTLGVLGGGSCRRARGPVGSRRRPCGWCCWRGIRCGAGSCGSRTPAGWASPGRPASGAVGRGPGSAGGPSGPAPRSVYAAASADVDGSLSRCHEPDRRGGCAREEEVCRRAPPATA